MPALFLAVSALLVLSSVYVLIPLLQGISLSLQASPTIVGYVNTGFSIFYAIGFLFTGAAAMKYGNRKIIVYGLYLLAGVTFITGLSRSIEELIVLRSFQGFAAAAFAPTALTYIAENYPTKERITVTSWITTGFIAAGVIGQVIGAFVEHLLGWQGVFGGLCADLSFSGSGRRQGAAGKLFAGTACC